MNDTRSVVIALAFILAPVSLVLIIALLRGYRIEVYMRRDRNGRRGRRE